MNNKQSNIIISPEASDMQRRLFETIVTSGVPRQAEVIYGGRRNTIYRYEPGDGTVVSIKAYRVPPFPNPYVYGRFRQSKARRAYENACRLIGLGFATPAPLGYIETWRDGRFDRSYYLCRHLDEMGTVRDLADLPDSEGIIRDMAQLMFNLRSKGVDFRDFSPGNVLYRPDGSGGYMFSLVDINRMTFDEYSHAETMRMFRAITLDERTLSRITAAYARIAGEDADRLDTEAQEQLRTYKRHQARKRLLKRLRPRRRQ